MAVAEYGPLESEDGKIKLEIEGLRAAKDHLVARIKGIKDRAKGKLPAAMAMLNELHEAGITKTPDGAPYSVTTIKAAMSEM